MTPPVPSRFETITDTASRRVRSLVDSARVSVPGTHQIRSDREHLDAAIEWLTHSQKVTGTSGSAATYNLLLGWEPPYPETSGYIVPTLLRYADRYDDSSVRERALEMAAWTLSVQHEQGSFPGGTGDDGEPNAFNTGQILIGLVAAFEETGEERYREAVRRACDWLVSAQSPEGHWAAHDYRSEPHAYTTRVAWPLVLGAGILDGDVEPYHQAAQRNLRWAVENQRPNGWFDHAAFEPGDNPFLHTIAYTVRGLLEAGLLLEDDEFVAAATRTADVLLEMQGNDGVLRGAYDKDWSPAWYYCLTGNAQMAVIWARLHELTGDREYLLAARTSVQFIKRHQPLDAAVDVRGGVPGSYPQVGRYAFLRYPNWATKFFADAVMELESARERAATTITADVVDTDEGDREAGPLRMCLLVDGEHVFRWVAEAIEQLLAETDTEVTLVVSNRDNGLLGSGNVKRGRRYPAYAAYWLLSKVVARTTDEPRYDDPIHVSDIPGIGEPRWIRTLPGDVEGLWNELPAEIVEEVRENADIVFRRGFGLMRGEILDATEYGVLSYHHGDPGAYRGGPAGFWEFVHGEPTAGMMVQSLQDNLDAGGVQAYGEVDIEDCRSWRAVRARLYPASTHLLTEAVRRVRSGDRPIEVDSFGPVYHPPSAPELARFLVTSARRRFGDGNRDERPGEERSDGAAAEPTASHGGSGTE